MKTMKTMKMMTKNSWLQPADDWDLSIPIVVGYSIKGGVGRTLALTVFARYLSGMGKSVALVDMDLESPGLGSLLGDDNKPKFGVIDWLTESIVDKDLIPFTDDYCAIASSLSIGKGSVFYVPSFGKESNNYINKLENILSINDKQITFTNRLQKLMEAIAKSDISPDVIIIDSRAGLHDIGASIITGLKAEVMLFARDEPQSWDAYKNLFEHLCQSPQVQWGNQDEDLRSRLKMVGAQLVDFTVNTFKKCLNSSFDTWLSLYDEVYGNCISDYILDDKFAHHYIIPINFVNCFLGFKTWNGFNFHNKTIDLAFGEFNRLWAERLGLFEVNI